MHLATAFKVKLEVIGSEDDLRTVSSNAYVPLAEADSDNDNDCERWFHWESRWEVQRERRMTAGEYSHFSI